MHKFNYIEQVKELMTPEVVSLLCGIYEHKGKQEMFLNCKQEILDDMLDFALFNSTESSNRIEGIETSHQRLNSIVREKVVPKSRAEEEILGYKEVLELIHTSHEFISIKPGIILQLHRDLMKHTDVSFGGVYKSTDNIIQEIDRHGNKKVRFQPVSAVATEGAVEEMCESFNEALQDPYTDSLLASMMFILDFLCIHPFNDGNGRLSRLFTLLLLYKCGLIVGKYISIEKIIERTKETYYESLKFSSYDWHDNKSDYEFFVRYMLGIIIGAYKDFETRIKRVTDEDKNKPQVVEAVIDDTLGKISKSEIMENCPGISQVTVQRALSDLQKEGKIKKVGGGRYSYYVSSI